MQTEIEFEGEAIVITMEPAEFVPVGAPTGLLQCEFALKKHLVEYEDATGPVESPWIRTVGFRRPAALLRLVFLEALQMAKTQARPFIVDGSDAQRRRIYCAMLRRAGVAAKVLEYSGWAKRDVLMISITN